MKKVISGVLGIIMIITLANGQDVSEDLFDLSLEELMNIEIDVASGKGTTLRESPGIISYIDAEEIKNSGARDFMDILRMVPGFEFGSDVDNSIGLGVRGNWGFEGKVLILLDGQALNETSYGTFTFSQRIPIDNIQKIEIIRGPGSALYGGVAGLAVIKVTTKNGADLNGAQISANYGISNGTSLRRNIQASFGKAFSEEFNVSVSAYLNKGNQSAETYDAIDGTSINYKDSSDLSAANINLGMNYKDLSLRFIYDELDIRNQNYDGYTKFSGIYFGADYDIKLSDKFTVTPKFQYKKQDPWSYVKPKWYDDTDYYNVFNNRLLGNITANWDASEKLNFVFGTEYYQDKSTFYIEDEEWNVFSNGEQSISFSDFSVFAQGTYNSKFANITAGIRYDDHSAVDAAFVPRIALTKVVNDWHFKLLYSQAFKTPVIENVNLNPDIKPERIEVAEFETGYRLNENMILTANLFYTKIKDVIVYSEDEVDGEYIYDYQNYPNSGTHGFEIDYKYKGKWGFVNAGYSYYKANKDADVEAYQIAGNDNLFLGFSGHKFSANAHVKLAKNLYLNPSLLFFSEKYYYEYDADWELVLNKMDNILLGHINLTYENLLTEGLDLGVGVYNIGNAKDKYPQPYYGGNYPVLAPGREFNFNLKYRFGF